MLTITASFFHISMAIWRSKKKKIDGMQSRKESIKANHTINFLRETKTSQNNIICECQDNLAAPFCSLALTVLLISPNLSCPRGFFCAAPMRYYAHLPLLLITLLQGIFHTSIFSEWLVFYLLQDQKVNSLHQSEGQDYTYVRVKDSDIFKPFALVKKQ